VIQPDTILEEKEGRKFLISESIDVGMYETLSARTMNREEEKPKGMRDERYVFITEIVELRGEGVGGVMGMDIKTVSRSVGTIEQVGRGAGLLWGYFPDVVGRVCSLMRERKNAGEREERMMVDAGGSDHSRLPTLANRLLS
jgi:hypothetical protein